MTTPPEFLPDPPESRPHGDAHSAWRNLPRARFSFRWEQLLEQALGQGQACEVLGRKAAVGLDAEALEDVDQLARVLRRMPGRALESPKKRLETPEARD